MFPTAFKFSEKYQLKLEAEVRNLFNQNAVLARVTQMQRSNSAAITSAMVSEKDFFTKGYNPANFIGTGKAIAIAPTYGLPAAVNRYRGGGSYDSTLSSAFYAANPNFGAYQEGRGLRLGLRFVVLTTPDRSSESQDRPRGCSWLFFCKVGRQWRHPPSEAASRCWLRLRFFRPVARRSKQWL